jgi:EpsI family protein
MKTMSKPLIVSLMLGMLMVLSGVLTRVMTHPNQIDAHQAAINLETIIPHEFDGWKIDLTTAALVVNPDDKSLLNKLYNQTLSRTYNNNEGEQVMLSVAYGRNQSSDLHVHRPEICYATAGFDISDMSKTFVDTSIGRIPVMHLVAKRGNRNEPVTYWIRVGDSLTRGWFEQKLTAISYGLSGKVPDGLLVRVSTISNNEQESYKIQQTFLAALLQAVRSEDRYWLVGHLNP